MMRIILNNKDITHSIEDGLIETEMTLSPSNKLLIKSKSPINYLYFNLKKTNELAHLVFEESVEELFTSLKVEDRTIEFKRSGFIDFKHSKQHSPNPDGDYVIAISADSNMNIKLSFIGILFSSESDLQISVNNVQALVPKNIGSQLLKLIEARNIIITRINNAGLFIYNNKEVKDVRPEHILNRDELKEASNYLALHCLFRDLQDGRDDVFLQKSEGFANSYERSFAIFKNGRLTLDQNEDGQKDKGDTKNNGIITLWR